MHVLIRNAVAVTMLLFCNDVIAASAYWSDVYVSSNGRGIDDAIGYTIWGRIYGEDGRIARISTHMYGSLADDGLHLKQDDFSRETMDATFNWWAIVSYGEIVDETTFHDATKQVELFYGDAEYLSISGTMVENPDDFYMAFKASEVLLEGGDYVEGQPWYGWVHVSVDDTDLKMTLLGSGINLYGGAVTVGAIPEPSSALLLLIGGAALSLRRRRWST